MNVQLMELSAAARHAWSEYRASGRTQINVVLDTSSLARGAQETIDALHAQIAARKLDADVGIIGSFGFCWMEPTVTVRSRAGTRTVLYANVTADRVPEFLETTVEKGQDMPALALGVVEGNSTPEIALLADHPFMKGQVRRLMANIGLIDPESIDHYIAQDGYAGFGRALEMDAEAIVKLMIDSGLGGRGGAGFLAGRKWDFLRTATADPRYLICNADEGDPGAWVNRILLEGDPHLIVEGMLIAALASKASAGYIYIRYEYPLAVERMQRAVDQARAKGLLGKGILGTDLDFELHVVKGAGSYVCGEETGLIASIDGYRGMPRIKPPFPAQAGLWNKPSNVNNVETYANAPMILRNGAEWWSAVSGEKDKGTKMFTFSGAVNWAGCIEIPFGQSVQSALDQYAGGMAGGKRCKGYQPGGPLSGMLAASDLGLALAADPFRNRFSDKDPQKNLPMFLGSGGVIFFDESACVLDLCKFFAAFCEDESCGRCTTCHGGTQRSVEIIRRIQQGGGREVDLDNLEELRQTLRWSNCLHGQFAMTAIATSIRSFRDEWLEHIVEKRCRAGVCDGLIEYRIRNQADANLPEAMAICPTGAITQERGQYAIDDGICVRCGACKELAPGAIEVRDRLAQPVAAGSAAAS